MPVQLSYWVFLNLDEVLSYKIDNTHKNLNMFKKYFYKNAFKIADHFSGCIAMSGSLLSHFAVDRSPKNNTEMIAENNNCPLNDTVGMVQCLRKLPAKNFVDHDTKQESLSTKVRNFLSDLSSLMGAGPVIDGENDLR